MKQLKQVFLECESLTISAQFSRVALLGSFKVFKLLKGLGVCTFLFNKCISLKDVFRKTKIIRTDLAFLAQTSKT